MKHPARTFHLGQKTGMAEMQRFYWSFFSKGSTCSTSVRLEKIYRVSAPAMPVRVCIFLMVFLEISTP